MRAIVRAPERLHFKRAMIYEADGGCYLFLFYRLADGPFDEEDFFASEEEAKTYCRREYGIPPHQWKVIEDPLPEHQDDWITPTRTIDRAATSPKRRRFEQYQDGEWKEVALAR